LHGTEPFLRNRHLCRYSRKSKHFMENEGSLQCTSETTACPHPERDQSSPQYHILTLRSILLLITHLRTFLLFSNITYTFLFAQIHATFSANLILRYLLILVILGEEYNLALSSSETSVLTRATQRNIPEDCILHSHRRENLNSYIALTGWTLAET
jgi:hypothetical protein